MNPRSSAGSGWRWITAAIMAHDGAFPRARGHRHVPIRQARAGQAAARGRRGPAAPARGVERLPAGSRRGSGRDVGASSDRLAQLPEQPDRRGRTARVPAPRSGALPRARLPARVRRGARRAHSGRVPAQARGVAADARAQRLAHCRRTLGDDVPLDRGAVGRRRGTPARARHHRLARDVLWAGRRRLLPDRARAYGRGMPARRHHPRARLVNVDQIIAALDRGEVRVAEPVDGDWRVNSEAQEAILEYFRARRMEPQEVGPFQYHDKIPLKRNYEELGVRVVPPAVARYGAYLAPGVVMMPSYVNIGAWVGPRTMVDTWATVGSCAQVGADVHLSGGVGLGGVLEPVNARPVIVEDGAFLGSRCIVTEGVVIGEQAVLGPNVVLTGSVPIIDVTGPEPVEHRGVVPPRS